MKTYTDHPVSYPGDPSSLDEETRAALPAAIVVLPSILIAGGTLWALVSIFAERW